MKRIGVLNVNIIIDNYLQYFDEFHPYIEKDFFVFMCVCVLAQVYVHHVHVGVSRVQKNLLPPLGLESHAGSCVLLDVGAGSRACVVFKSRTFTFNFSALSAALNFSFLCDVLSCVRHQAACNCVLLFN